MQYNHTYLNRSLDSNSIQFIVHMILICSIGLVALASASIPLSMKTYGVPLRIFYAQLFYLFIGLISFLCMASVPIRFIKRVGPMGLAFSFIILISVFIPGVSHPVNGSVRWLKILGLSFQVSELAKYFFILYLASYFDRRLESVQSTYKGFLIPFGLTMLVSSLVLLEPDFGTAFVLTLTALSLLFFAGVAWSHFLCLGVIVFCVLAGILVLSPYRLARMASFLDPWSHEFSSGYQLTQALIAFGRGGVFGEGLGNSIQKLSYLPEAHTDFILAIFAEEFGLVGVLVLMVFYALLLQKIYAAGIKAKNLGLIFEAFLAFGIGFILSYQILINIGVNLGMLPTKGLTLPLVSKGGTSLVVTLLVLSLPFRIHYELENHEQRTKFNSQL